LPDLQRQSPTAQSRSPRKQLANFGECDICWLDWLQGQPGKTFGLEVEK
jgi:hypothetical protein